MQISTRQFGTLEFGEEAVFTFAKEILGFPQYRRFILMEEPDQLPLRWLQSVEEPELAFAVVDPRLFFPDYEVPLAADDRRVLDLAPGEKILSLAIVTIPSDPRLMTANLQGPILIASRSRKGIQVVLYDSPYSCRQRLLPDPAPVSV